MSFFCPFFFCLTQISYLQFGGVVRELRRKLEESAGWCGPVRKLQAESRPEFESAINFLWPWTTYSTSRGPICFFYKKRELDQIISVVPAAFKLLLPSFTLIRFLGLKTDIFLGEALSAPCRHLLAF